MEPYDDDRYLAWQLEFQRLITEFLNVEGNTVNSLQGEFEEAVDSAELE